MKRLLLPLVSGMFIAGQAHAFIVKNIKLEGLQRVSSGTVYHALPIAVGDDVDSQRIAQAIKALFKKGYFSDIQIDRDQDTLVVKVKERAAISEITVSGNKIIPKDSLKRVLKQANLAENDIYVPATLTAIRKEIENQYVLMGYYSASVATKVRSESNNRVSISIEIREGNPVTVAKINILGAHAFSQKTLLDLLQLKIKNWLSWATGDNKYAKEKLRGDTEILRSYYMDHGYINFQITSTQVSVTPDKKQVYITINVNEGHRYKLGKLTLGGNLILPEPEVKKLITAKTGETFSQRNITDISDSIANKLGEKGYIFADVNPIPDIDEKNDKVDITFFVNPGKQVYVRRINFKGNTRTRDEVLRREMRQLEKSLANKSDISNSTEHLNRVGFFKNIDLKTAPVSSASDQVDLNYSLEEQDSGAFMVNLGYSQNEGFLLGASVSHANFLGTGNAVSLGASTSKYERNYSFSYDNPYYTVDGVSRGFGVYYNTVNYNKSSITNYDTNQIGGDVNFGYPVSDDSRIFFSLGLSKTQIKAGNQPAYVVKQYLDKNGKDSTKLSPVIGWYKSKLNYGVLPTAGHDQSVSLELSVPKKSSQAFYKLNWKGQYLYPLNSTFSLQFRGHAGYGNGIGKRGLPFYENFLAGGLGSVRGFSYKTLGPQALRKVVIEGEIKKDKKQIVQSKQSTSTTYDPIGGNITADGTVALLFPMPFVKDKRSMQGSLFLDGGNVWSSVCKSDTVDGKKMLINCRRPGFNSISFSAGFGVEWLTPIGQLSFNFAKPIKKEKTDKQHIFQFNIGKSF